MALGQTRRADLMACRCWKDRNAAAAEVDHKDEDCMKEPHDPGRMSSEAVEGETDVQHVSEAAAVRQHYGSQ